MPTKNSKDQENTLNKIVDTPVGYGEGLYRQVWLHLQVCMCQKAAQV